MKKRNGVKWLVFVFLCSLCAAAMSLSSFGGTQARHRTRANIPNRVQIARFDPVWTPAAGDPGIGGRNSAMVFHPGNWNGRRPVRWYLTNNSDVMVHARIVPMWAVGPPRRTAPLDTARIGDYVNPVLTPPATRTPLVTGVFGPGSQISIPAAAFPAQGARNIPFNTASPPTTHAFSFCIWGPFPRPARHPNDVNIGFATVTQANPMRFGVGSSTMDMASTGQHWWWRAYRINMDAFITQVD